MKIKIVLVLSLVLSLASCGSTNDDSRGIAPEISLISPSDTLSLSAPIPVRILLSDNNGLLYTEVKLQKPGDTLYYETTFFLNGLSQELSFTVDTPFSSNFGGQHLIEVLCVDEDDNRSFQDTGFYLR